MISTFKQNIYNTIIPPLNDKNLMGFVNALNFGGVIIKVPIIPKPLCRINECHKNVIRYVNIYGGKQIKGIYILKEKKKNNYVGITHSIWENSFGEKVDITPVSHNCRYNVFLPIVEDKLNFSRVEYFQKEIYFDYYIHT